MLLGLIYLMYRIFCGDGGSPCFIYIYIYRERERERGVQVILGVIPQELYLFIVIDFHKILV